MTTSLTSAFTLDTLRQHGLTSDEYEKIRQLLGQREPTLTELGIFSVMWSDHCSHNHPSFIEPFQGATTGVGGILRDIFTMGARPVAVMDSLRFGPITAESRAGDSSAQVTRKDIHKNHSILEGVVSGIAGYGNCRQSVGERFRHGPGSQKRDLLRARCRRRQSGYLRGRQDRTRRYPRRDDGQRGIQRGLGGEASQRAGW